MHDLFQAEDGIRYMGVTGVQTCALPICRRVGSWSSRETIARASTAKRSRSSSESDVQRPEVSCSTSDRKSVVKGKSVDLGGRRIIKKKQNALRYILSDGT